MTTQLDTAKIKRLLKIHNKNKSWLARQLGMTRQGIHYHLESRSLKSADKIAKVFGLKGKDLIT